MRYRDKTCSTSASDNIPQHEDAGTLIAIILDLQTWRFWRHLLIALFACLGALSTAVQTFNALNPIGRALAFHDLLTTLIGMSVIGALLCCWPRKVAQDYHAPATRISIVPGDILDETGHLVIATNDTFDTQTPHIIASDSLQGQALQRLFGGDVGALDRQLAAALKGRPVVCTLPKHGKQRQYGIGSIATLPHARRLVFFLAYCEMDNQNVAHSTPDNVWKSLMALWSEVSKKANGGTLSMPVIGGRKARLSNILPAQDAIRLTLLSFMFASRTSKICDELRIVVRPEDYQKLDRPGLQSFLGSLRTA